MEMTEEFGEGLRDAVAFFYHFQKKKLEKLLSYKTNKQTKKRTVPIRSVGLPGWIALTKHALSPQIHQITPRS